MAQRHHVAIVKTRFRFADAALDLDRAHAPAGVFNDCTVETAVLGWVLEQATGMSLPDRARVPVQREGSWRLLAGRRTAWDRQVLPPRSFAVRGGSSDGNGRAARGYLYNVLVLEVLAIASYP